MKCEKKSAILVTPLQERKKSLMECRPEKGTKEVAARKFTCRRFYFALSVLLFQFQKQVLAEKELIQCNEACSLGCAFLLIVRTVDGNVAERDGGTL